MPRTSSADDDADPARAPASWRVLLVGVLAGAASGLFGVGGGVVIVPGLVLVARFGQRVAHGTSLTAIVPIALAGTISYAAAGEVDWVAAGPVAAGALLGAPVGVALLARLPAGRLRVGFALLLLLTAVRLVLDAGDGTGRGAVDLLDAAGYLATGLASGVLAGLMGVGGGVIIVPALTLLFGLPLVVAKGTSLAVIAPTAVLGTVRNLRQGTTDLRVGTIVGVGGVVSAALASWVSIGLDPELSAALFAGLIVLVAIRMLRAGPPVRSSSEPSPVHHRSGHGG